MLKMFRLNRTYSILICASIMAAVILGGIATMFAAPGDESDPVVTLSYITKEILPKISDARLSFQAVNLSEGQRLIGNGGTELILRMGKADVIATQKGGLANATEGVDLPDGAPMPANSLIIVPVTDNRGILAKNDVIVLVKGDYQIN